MENFTNNSIEIGSLPQFEEVDFQLISKSYLLKSYLLKFLLLCAAVIVWVVLFYYDINLVLTSILAVFIVVYFPFKFWNTFKVQDTYGFALREKDLLFKRGYFICTTTVVPFNRIQHVSISRDVLDKYLKISTLKIFTAGGSGSDIIIPGLTTGLALRLKEALAVKLTANGL